MIPPFETINEFGNESIKHGFFGRRGGVSSGDYYSLNLGTGSNDCPSLVSKNREIVCATFDAARIYSCHQVHGRDSVIVKSDTPNRLVGDIMVTQEESIALCVLTADCVPVLMAEPNARMVVAVHAGWRGAVGGVIEAALDQIEYLGGNRECVQAAIGPCILKQSYEVGRDFYNEVLETTAWAEEFFEVKGIDRWYFDLPNYVISRLLRASCSNVVSILQDTYSMEEVYFSNRRRNKQGHLDYGRNGSVIMLKH